MTVEIEASDLCHFTTSSPSIGVEALHRRCMPNPREDSIFNT